MRSYTKFGASASGNSHKRRAGGPNVPRPPPSGGAAAFRERGGRGITSPLPGEGALRYAALLFDFGGTLDADGVTWRERLFRLLRRTGLPADEGRFSSAFFRADDALPLCPRVAEFGLRDTIDRLVAGCCEELGYGDAGVRARLAEAFEVDTRAALARSRELLARLRPRYRIGIVSNFHGNLTRVLREAGLADLVESVAESAVVGATKPEPRIFLAALGPLGVEPARALMVGDSLARDMAGARALGMPHLLVAGPDAAERQPCCPADGRIERLAELPSWLEAQTARCRVGGGAPGAPAC